MRFGHDRKGTDVRPADFGIMLVMMIVRTPPDAARTQRKNPEDAHEKFRQPGFRQNGVMLLVVINDKKPQQKQSRENAANNFPGQIEIPKRAGDCQQQQPRCGKDAPPARRRVVRGIRSRRQNEFFARFYAGVKILCFNASEAAIHVGI